MAAWAFGDWQLASVSRAARQASFGWAALTFALVFSSEFCPELEACVQGLWLQGCPHLARYHCLSFHSCFWTTAGSVEFLKGKSDGASKLLS